MLRLPSISARSALAIGRIPIVLVLASLATACSRSLVSPPSALVTLSSPASIGEGRTSVNGAVYAGGDVVFGPTVVGASAEIRHGLTDRIDVGTAVAATVVVGGEVADPPHRGVYSARGFTHVVLVPRVLSLQAGLGGGASAAGGYLSPDLGVILGYENRYFVPYLHGATFSSIPLTHRELNLRFDDETEDDFRKAFPSIGFRFGVGARIPIGHGDDPDGSLLLEWSASWFQGIDPREPDDTDSERSVVVGSVAYRHRFAR